MLCCSEKKVCLLSEVPLSDSCKWLDAYLRAVASLDRSTSRLLILVVIVLLSDSYAEVLFTASCTSVRRFWCIVVLHMATGRGAVVAEVNPKWLSVNGGSSFAVPSHQHHLPWRFEMIDGASLSPPPLLAENRLGLVWLRRLRAAEVGWAGGSDGWKEFKDSQFGGWTARWATLLPPIFNSKIHSARHLLGALSFKTRITLKSGVWWLAACLAGISVIPNVISV